MLLINKSRGYRLCHQHSSAHIVDCLAYSRFLMPDDDHCTQDFSGVKRRKMFLAFIYYHFHLFLKLARQKICITLEHRHDVFRYAFPPLHKIKYMLYNNWYCIFMLNWNILDFDRLNRYIQTERQMSKNRKMFNSLYLNTANYEPGYQCCFLRMFLRKWVTHTSYDKLKNGSTYAKMIWDIFWTCTKWML